MILILSIIAYTVVCGDGRVSVRKFYIPNIITSILKLQQKNGHLSHILPVLGQKL